MNDLNLPTPLPDLVGEIDKKDYLFSLDYQLLLGKDLETKKLLKKTKNSKFDSTQINRQNASTLVFQIYDEVNQADYNLTIRRFVDFICPDKKIAFIHRDTLIDFKKYLEKDAKDKWGKKLKPATQRKYFLVAKDFVTTLHKNGSLAVDITTLINGKTIKAPKAPSSGKKPFTQYELKKILDAYRELNDTKLKLLICLLYFHGLRIGEIAKLDFNSFDVPANTLTIRGKGGYIDIREMHSQLAQCFREYSKEYKPRTALFVTKDKPTSKRTLQHYIGNFLDNLKIHGKSPHIFRHSAIMELAKTKGTTLDDLKYFSRHQSIQSLAAYFHVIKSEKSHQKIEKALVDHIK
ncbi:MAG: site-specific integrase [Candidatus Saccharibacteria bacterium]|nr:site-specific integrase [Candidatus Saccharibacteria bacterium]